MNITQIIKNAGSTYAGMVVGTVSALVLTPVIVHRLGSEAFGLWVVTQSISSYFGLLDLGITSASVKYISQHRALGDKKSLNDLIETSFTCYCTLAAVSLLIALLLVPHATTIFHAHSGETVKLLILSVGVISALGFLSVIPTQCTIAAQRQDLLNCCLVVIDLVRSITTFAGLLMGGGVVFLSATLAVSALAYCAASFILARRLMPHAEFKLGWHKAQAALILPFAGFAFISSVAGRVIYSTDSIVISTFLSIGAVAGYAIAFKIAGLVRSLVAAGAGVLGTFASEQSALGKQESLGSIWLQGSKWALTVTLPACAACILLPEELITSWVGHSYAGAAVALSLLAVTVTLDTTQSSAYQVLMNAGYHRPLAIITSCEAALNLVMSIALIHSLGIVGVAAGTLIPALPRTLIFYPICMRRVTGVGLAAYLQKAVIPAALSTILPVAIITVYKINHWHSGRISIIYLALGAAIALATGVLIFGLSENQRRFLKQRLAGRREKSPLLPLNTVAAEVEQARDLMSTAERN